MNKTITLPCDIGDDVYSFEWNKDTEQLEVCKDTVKEVRYSLKDNAFMVSNGEWIAEWMKKMFPTRELAEREVKRRN